MKIQNFLPQRLKFSIWSKEKGYTGIKQCNFPSMVLPLGFKRGNGGYCSGVLFMPIWCLDSCKYNIHPWQLVIFGSICNTDNIKHLCELALSSTKQTKITQSFPQPSSTLLPALFQVCAKEGISSSLLILGEVFNFTIKCELATCHCVLHSLLCRASKGRNITPKTCVLSLKQVCAMQREYPIQSRIFFILLYLLDYLWNNLH